MFVLPFMWDLWARPEQRLRADREWLYHGLVAGRGWGKTAAIGYELNRRVECGDGASHIGLMAPTDIRCDEVQLSTLIATAPPWFAPERYRGGLVWPNGVQAVTFTPLEPERPRSENIEVSWLCELVDWNASTRRRAFDNITTATRVGASQVFWDTTSQGTNDVISYLLDLHDSDPHAYPITRGTTFDNPMLTGRYLKAECAKYAGQRLAEELLGRIFGEAEGAAWESAWINKHRVAARIPPSQRELTIVSVDPALSDHADADDVGIVVADRDRARHAYLAKDLSAKLKPEAWGDLVVSECVNGGAAGAVIERNHLGDNATFVIRSRARNVGWDVRVLERGERFPARQEGVVFVRENVSGRSKTVRASGPAAETEAGRVHVVGTMPALENELVTYVPGSRRSPNRYDAAVYAILELLELQVDAPRVTVRDVHTARAAQTEIRRRLAGVRGSRRVGL